MEKRRYASAAAALLLAASLLGACSKGDSKDGEGPVVKVNETGMPIVDEKIQVEGFGAKRFASQDWDNLMLWDEYEKMTNIEVKWHTVATEVLAEKRNLELSAGNYPEFYFAAAIPKADLIKYGRQGVFLPLNDYIEKYAPNFKAILEQYPSIKAGITMADGNIYGFPAIYDPEFDALRAGTPWILQEWLDNVGMKEPETTEELYQVLKAFKEQDPNGNGIADEIPWGGGDGINAFIDFLRGSFGLNKQGRMNINLDFKEGTETFRFVPATDEYKELLKYLNKLYTEGLINQDVFTTTGLEFTTLASKGNIGVLSEIDPKTLMKLDGYVGLPVLEGPTGERAYNAVSTGLGNMGMFVLTEKAKNPEAMVRWMDHFYGEEGNKMFFMGFEGVTYENDENGNPQYMENITNNPDGLNLDQAISEYLTWPGGYYPGIVRQKFFQGAEGTKASAENAAKAKPFRVKDEDIIPGLNYTMDEQDQVSSIMTDIQTYIDEMTAGFITGRKSFDEWGSYIDEMNKMGAQTYLEISQQAYDRMKVEK
ncbi:extracellular solute-binding protein [Sporosarcina sp. Te-1]|uniref:extracellular solute-binding protein n=1 Tax=Sporosarcina sp. Te-1 TaxID=2818390 RepID=UPI001A9D3DDC|nr:extracellular solute-binding protein [Sporosarcina sp. Te-1]QTD39458.1 extracellular solute-binding protein [Sporosarcina sp. Te-1]